MLIENLLVSELTIYTMYILMYMYIGIHMGLTAYVDHSGDR